MTTSDWLSAGALVVSVISFVYTIYSSKHNTKDTQAAQQSAEKANEISQRANELAEKAHLAVQQLAEAQSRPYLSFVQEQVAGAWCGFLKNVGNAPAHNIEINVKIADDTPQDQRGDLQLIANILMNRYRGISMGPGERHDVCSMFQHLKFLEVTNLKYKNPQGAQFSYSGRAQLLREDIKRS